MKRADYSTSDGMSANVSGDPGDFVAPEKISSPDGQNIRETFARNLRLWRTARDLSMKVVASDVGVDESTYCLWEVGKRFPNAENLDAIAMYAKLPICRFFRNGDSFCGNLGLNAPDDQRATQLNPE